MADKYVPFKPRPPGARVAGRRSTAARPWMQEHWVIEQLESICDHVVTNPWVASKLGGNVDVSVRISEDGHQIAFLFSKPGQG